VTLKPGVTKITAERLRNLKSYNILDIVLKGVPLCSTEQMYYLTTGDIIETYIGTMSSQIIVNKAGSDTASINAT